MRNCAGLYRFVDWLLRWTDTVQSILLKMNNTVKIRYQLYTFQFVCYGERNEQKGTLNLSAFAGYPQLVSAFLLHNYRWPVIYVLGAKSQSQPAQQAFPCGLGTKNEEQESKTSRKMAQVKERAGGGEERKFPSFPSPSPSFIFWHSFHFSRGQSRGSRSSTSVFLFSQIKQKRLLRRLSQSGKLTRN